MLGHAAVAKVDFGAWVEKGISGVACPNKHMTDILGSQAARHRRCHWRAVPESVCIFVFLRKGGQLPAARLSCLLLCSPTSLSRCSVIFKQLLQADAISFCQIDSCRIGGVNEILAVLLMAAKFGGVSTAKLGRGR